MNTSTPDKVRIWQNLNGGHVRLTLHDGDQVTHRTGGATDEGYSYREETWSYNRAEGVVTLFILDEGSDCDGRISHRTRLFAPLDKLTAFASNEGPGPAVWMPDWQLLARDQRDYSAEAMNY